MSRSIARAVVFVAIALATLLATGPLVAMLVAMAGVTSPPIWFFAGFFSALLLTVTAVALHADGQSLASLGLALTRRRIGEFGLGFAVSAVLFVLVALTRGAIVGAVWSFSGLAALPTTIIGVAIALLLLFPEELIFRGYAFRRLVDALGAWPAILVSALLFGAYHVVGSGMWAMGALFQFLMPALGGLVFGWAAVRSKGLALPSGLHLGGNWVQASVLAFQSESADRMAALWVAPLSATQAQTLWAPDLIAHLPFIAAMMTAAAIVTLAPRVRNA